MLDRWVENGLLNVLDDNGVGCIAFSPLAQGLLTNRYLNGIPEDSRAAKEHGFLKTEQITNELLSKINQLNSIALNRNQTLAQMAIAWLLKKPQLTSVLIGVSKESQLNDCLLALKNTHFTNDELKRIEKILE